MTRGRDETPWKRQSGEGKGGREEGKEGAVLPSASYGGLQGLPDRSPIESEARAPAETGERNGKYGA